MVELELELDDDPPEPMRGYLEGEPDDVHEPHGAGWLYVPDLASVTQWATHRVGPAGDPLPRRPVGFGR